ncbi:isochorismatase family protein, partial [Pseudomonas viridiflava]
MDIRPDSALILIDMQQGINHPRLGRRNNPQAEARMSELLSAWREAGRPVIHVRHFSTSPSSVFWPEQSGVEYQPAFVPQADERELSKQVPDAFCGSFLEMWLRSDGIRQMVIAGVV